MARERLSDLTEWQLEDESQDLRGRILLDRSGQELGEIREMIIDSDREQVDTVVLDTGAEYPVSDIDITADNVRLREAAGGRVGARKLPLVEPAVLSEETLRKTGVEPVGTVEYEKDFRDDFARRYTGRGFTYDQYEPAYRFGSNYGSNPLYYGREWHEIEPQARRDWGSSGKGNWEDFKDAIRNGFDVARGRRTRTA